MEVDVNRVKTNEEVDKRLLFRGRNVSKQSRCDDLASGEWFVDRNVKDERLCIDIANVNTTLVGEENLVALALRVDADVVLCV